MAITNLTADNFEQEVLQSEKTVLVDFWAAWCGPCKMLAPIMDQIAQEHPEIKVAKVNIDEEASLAVTYKVMRIPTLLLFKDGEVVNRTEGVQPKAELEAMIS